MREAELSEFHIEWLWLQRAITFDEYMDLMLEKLVQRIVNREENKA